MAAAQAGYLEDPAVPSDSRTPTFAAAVLYVDNERWAGVPFVLKAGKALNERKAEVRIQLQDPPGAASTFPGAAVPRNEIVMLLQPEVAIYLMVFFFPSRAIGFNVLRSSSFICFICWSPFNRGSPYVVRAHFFYKACCCPAAWSGDRSTLQSKPQAPMTRGWSPLSLSLRISFSGVFFGKQANIKTPGLDQTPQQFELDLSYKVSLHANFVETAPSTKTHTALFSTLFMN